MYGFKIESVNLSLYYILGFLKICKEYDMSMIVYIFMLRYI